LFLPNNINLIDSTSQGREAVNVWLHYLVISALDSDSWICSALFAVLTILYSGLDFSIFIPLFLFSSISKYASFYCYCLLCLMGY